MKPLRIAALVKQIPRFEEMQLGPDGRLKRDGVELAMNPYCLRAVSQGVDLAQKTGGSCTVISLGPPAAEDPARGPRPDRLEPERRRQDDRERLLGARPGPADGLHAGLLGGDRGLPRRGRREPPRLRHRPGAGPVREAG